jgi:hypothetical protein
MADERKGGVYGAKYNIGDPVGPGLDWRHAHLGIQQLLGLCSGRCCRIAAGHHHHSGIVGSDIIQLPRKRPAVVCAAALRAGVLFGRGPEVMKSAPLLSLGLLLALSAGCISSHRPALVYTPPHVDVLSPTSDRLAPRVYASHPDPIEPPLRAAISDDRLAQSLDELLKVDPGLASTSHDVTIAVEKGLVTLRGTVPSEQARDRMVESISRVPGVEGINDRLSVN